MTQRFIGLMSGTSRDGVDAVLTEIREDGAVTVVDHCQLDYPDDLALELATAATSEALQYRHLGMLDARLGMLFARAVQTLLDQTGLAPGAIRAIGSHGQTVHHAPDAEPPFTWQIGDPFRIAEATGIDTVAQFRPRDIAAGGEGAPLACGFHAMQFGAPDETRAVLNLGGIANVTWLPPGAPVIGFDCGPANTLMDDWNRRHHSTPFDRDGDWARSGTPDPELLARLLEDPFFRRPPPKSTGPEYFSPAWLRHVAGDRLDQLRPEDLQATLAELTVEGVRRALTHLDPQPPARLLVCGGGAHNRYLMQRLAQALPDTRVESTERHGIPPQQVEGAAFAWLAARTLAGEPGNLPEVTGARGPRVLGCIIPGHARPTDPADQGR
ncbi:anhydro-N-acetylmuramic acid kinase [Thioalkalivibrio sp. ALE30]|uniref:anhydro-N-acetylmuramic acid kinase n=1 Tax=Thioalkalivibrio sp. ALE30 TaxID=1158181 RepID=UPI00037B64A2|nr:anhydro-N-acetylmuramic acid kinase [Thioalkalivibrio sp. ALE30]